MLSLKLSCLHSPLHFIEANADLKDKAIKDLDFAIKSLKILRNKMRFRFEWSRALAIGLDCKTDEEVKALDDQTIKSAQEAEIILEEKASRVPQCHILAKLCTILASKNPSQTLTYATKGLLIAKELKLSEMEAKFEALISDLVPEH